MTKATGSAAAFLKALDDAIGDNDEAQAVTSFIDTGYEPLNMAMSGRPDGGIPQGRLTEVFGESSTGKTALATKWMVTAQQMGGVAIFEDWERSFDVNLAQGFGLNIERPHWIYKRPKTWEEGNVFTGRAVKAIRDAGIIPDDAPIIAVHDSIAAAIPNSMLYDAKGNIREMDTYNMNDTTALARVTSTTLKTMAQIAGEYNATFVYLNQMRLKPGVVYGDPRCLRGDTMIPFVDGTTAAIEDIVKERISKQVWSYNEATGQIEPRAIAGWHDNGSIKGTSKKFLHIRAKTPETANGVSAITVTNDHKVLVSGKGWVNAEEVKVGDKMLTRSRNVFAGEGLEFLKGVLAGDASLRPIAKNRQGAIINITDKNDPAYAAWKAQVLSGVIPFTSINVAGGVRHSSAASAELARMVSVARDPVALFEGGMTSLQLALLIQDDGFFDTAKREGRYLISFKRFKGDHDKLDAIGDLFEKMGLSYSIRYGQGRIDFDTANSRKIAEMIAKHVHPSMERKLPEDLRGQFQDVVLTRANESVTVEAEVTEVREAGKKLTTRMYDITVEGNHNFLAGNALNGVVVHNCTPGGKAMEFYSTVRLALGREKITEGKGKDAEFAGQRIGIQVVKSKLTKPFQSAKLRLMYDDEGAAFFDTILSCIEYLTENKAITMAGAYIEWVDGSKSYPKALAKKIHDDPAMQVILRDLVVKALTA